MGTEEIISDNNNPTMINVTQQNHAYEVSVTLLPEGDNTEIQADSDYNSLASTGGLYSSSPIMSESSFGSIHLKTVQSGRETIEYDEDWGAIYSGVMCKDDKDEDDNIMLTSPKTESYWTYPKPEKKLVDFGLRLVILDKTLSAVGILAFIWATVVLLGGFASTLKTTDFWFVASIIFIVGTGIFSRNHQIESRFFFQAAKYISGKYVKIITFFQLIFACLSIVLSMMRLVELAYNEYEGQKNMKAALIIFYAVALTHALLFLLEKTYWHWIVSYLKIIEEVRDQCGFVGVCGVVSLRRFFHEAYWKLTQGSVFHALDLDLITFAQGLLLSNSCGDQLIAVRILSTMIGHQKFSQETRRRIRTSSEMMSRLVKMLSWHDKGEKAIRIFAAQIVIELVKEFQCEGIQDAEGIQEAVEFICSLLQQEDGSKRQSVEQNLLGLQILIGLAGNPMICLKITQKIDLLFKTVDFIRSFRHTFALTTSCVFYFRMAKRSLVLLKKIVSTNGKVGHSIRRNISESCTIGSNLRDILIYGRGERVIFHLVVEILKALSMDKAAQKKIGNTPGIIRQLLHIFLKSSNSLYDDPCCWPKAGEALAALTLESKRICCAILKENDNFVQQLIVALSKEEGHQSTALKILRNLCAYSTKQWRSNLEQVITTLPWVVKTMMSPGTTEDLLEASIGLCVQICKFTRIEEFTRILISEVNFSMIVVAANLQTILKKRPNAKIPCLRRYVIELVIWIMESDHSVLQYFKISGMKNVLVQTAETIAEFENFHYFSGNFGVMKHPKTLYWLVRKTEILLA